jgi:hypothetical protein
MSASIMPTNPSNPTGTVAEQIIERRIEWLLPSQHCDLNYLQRMITEALLEYGEQCRREALKGHECINGHKNNHCCCLECVIEDIKQARSEERERIAIKMAGICKCGNLIAEAIREQKLP